MARYRQDVAKRFKTEKPRVRIHRQNRRAT